VRGSVGLPIEGWQCVQFSLPTSSIFFGLPRDNDVPAPRRSDARRNRAAILRTASAELARGDSVASLERIARLAGLGKATVYRHFPDRHALADAVSGEQLALLARLVEEAAGDPAAFRPLLRAVLLTQLSMRPLVRVMREGPERHQQRVAQRMLAILSGPLRRAQQAGQLRADRTPADLILVFTMLEAAIERAADAEEREAAGLRAIDLLLDGFFAC
jgi:AcrR family transcriptional regulator